jgi:ligand-binding sensor domain-containing protein/signal transduction histidine kinase
VTTPIRQFPIKWPSGAKRCRALGCCLLFLSAVLAVQAQPLIFTHLGLNEGLSQSSVYSLFQDSKGFLWVGTGDGLNRYDGYQFKTYRTYKPPFALNNFCGSHIIEDSSGNLWCGSRYGINKYDYATDALIRVYPGNDSASFNGWIEPLGFDHDGLLWLWDHANLLAFDTDKNTFRQVKAENVGGVFSEAVLDKNGVVWYTRKKGIGYYNIRTGEFKNLLDDYWSKRSIRQVPNLYLDENGILWMTDEEKVISYNTHDGAISEITELRHPRSGRWRSVFAAKNTLWLGSETEGLVVYGLRDHKTVKYHAVETEKNTIATDIVTGVFIDRSDNIWVASDGYGLNKADLKTPKFLHYYKSKNDSVSLSDNFIRSFYEDEEGHLWIGTFVGLDILDRKANKIIHVKNDDNAVHTVRCIFKDAKGNILVGTDHGLKQLDKTRSRLSPISGAGDDLEQIRSAKILSMYQTKEGELLLGCRGGIYVVSYSGSRINSCRLISGTINYSIGMIYQSRDGQVWFGSTDGDFLYNFTKENGEWLESRRQMLRINVRSFLEFPEQNQLWMGTDMGILRYDLATNNYAVIDESSGLSNNHVYGMLQSDNGQIWISTNKGLSCYNRASGTFKNYDTDDGLQSNEFNSGAFYKSRSGELFFGGINGFNAFYPERITLNPVKPNVVLNHFMVNEENIPELGNPAGMKTVTLGYNSNTLSFDFVALEFTKPEKNRYRYRLVGADKDWVDAGLKHFARYTNLNPGTYRLYAMASNNDGLWSDAQLLCTLIIAPPWWMRWWALGAFAVLLLIGARLVFNYTLRRKMEAQQRILERQKAIEAERSRISKDMHDDLGSGLTKIAMMTQLLKTNTGNVKENIQFDKISETAGDLIDNMGQIIWAMNPENDDIENTLGYLRKFSLDFFEDSNIRCTVNFPSNTGPIKLSQLMRRSLFLVIKETFHNILKHSCATEVNIHASLQHNRLDVEITDNGKGFDPANAKSGGNGLSNMPKRMNDIGGTYELRSSHGNGTKTRLELFL